MKRGKMKTGLALAALICGIALPAALIAAVDGRIDNARHTQALCQSSPQRTEAQIQAYTEYFSKERTFDADGTPLDQGDFACNVDLDTQTLTITNKKTGETSNPITGKPIRIWRFGNEIYFYRNPDIIKYDLEMGESEVVLKVGDIVTVSELILPGLGEVNPDDDYPHLDINPELIFFIKDTSVHRYHVPSQTDEIVYQDDKIVSFKPLSNYELLITKMNPEWEKCVEETGNMESGIPECIEIKYSILEKSSEPYDIRPRSPMPEDVPMPAIDYGGWGPGSYFTKTGKKDSCHPCPYPPDSSCQCKEYNGAIQCMGYAKYVYSQSIGGSWGSYTNTLDFKKLDKNTAYAKLDNIFKNLPSGAHVRLGNRHSVAFGSPRNNAIAGYECNADGRSCLVTSAYYTYDELIAWGSMKTSE